MSSLRRLWNAARPAEKVLLGFAVYAVLRMIAARRFELANAPFPGQDVLLMLLGIVTARLAAEWWRTPFPEEHADARVRHRRMAFAFAAPPVIVLATLGFKHPAEYGDPRTIATWVLFGEDQAYRMGVTVIVPIFLWLMVGRRLRDDGWLRPGPLLRDGASVLGVAARDWLAPVLLIYAYSAMQPVLAVQLVRDVDPELMRIDRWLFFGHDPNLWMEHLISPALSEWMAACYVFYVPLLPLALGVAYAFDPRRFPRLAFAVALTLAVGYVGYSFFPAQGPVFTMHFDRSLDLYYLRFVKEQLMDRMRVPRDCFPSLHTALSLVLWRGIARSAPRLGWALAPIVLTIPVACVYLRYHYVIDVIAGLVLFGAVTLIARRIRDEAPTA